MTFSFKMVQQQFSAISVPQGASAHSVTLFTYTDVYHRAAQLGEIQARQVASSLSLAMAVQEALRSSQLES